MTAEATILQEIKKLRDDFSKFKQEYSKDKKKEVWVKASDVQRLTGWNKEQLRRHRDQGTIVCRRLKVSDKGGRSIVEYLLSSIPEQFINKPEGQEK